MQSATRTSTARSRPSAPLGTRTSCTTTSPRAPTASTTCGRRRRATTRKSAATRASRARAGSASSRCLLRAVRPLRPEAAAGRRRTTGLCAARACCASPRGERSCGTRPLTRPAGRSMFWWTTRTKYSSSPFRPAARCLRPAPGTNSQASTGSTSPVSPGESRCWTTRAPPYGLTGGRIRPTTASPSRPEGPRSCPPQRSGRSSPAGVSSGSRPSRSTSTRQS
mmetsp:Transcript_4083/g.11831  ORF Transcript_4083/g.11831 Transcript_4083/m.11831 type:complete len:223 (-) Transcript_4083:791-1459(-)